MLIWLSLTSVGIVAAFLFATAGGDPLPVVPLVLVSTIGVVTGAFAVYSVLRARAAAAVRS